MKRRLFNIAAGVSLLLLLATLTMWTRSECYIDIFSWKRPQITVANVQDPIQRYWEVISATGGVWIGIDEASDPIRYLDRDVEQTFSSSRIDGAFYMEIPDFTLLNEPGRIWLDDFGFVWGGYVSLDPSSPKFAYQHEAYIRIPYWTLATLMSLLSAIRAWQLARERIRRHHREASMSAGVCALCGYDLRATPERCPECGTAVTERMKAEEPALSKSKG